MEPDGKDPTELRPEDQEFSREVGNKEARKLRSRRERNQNQRVWFGFGMFGLVGWSVAIPTLMGAAIGLWIDTTWPSRFSCTLTFLFAGVALGCLNAWYWIQREGRHR
jgi:ATP synthase protein I